MSCRVAEPADRVDPVAADAGDRAALRMAVPSLYVDVSTVTAVRVAVVPLAGDCTSLSPPLVDPSSLLLSASVVLSSSSLVVEVPAL